LTEEEKNKKDENSANFELIFHFTPNEFIENEILTKKFFFTEHVDDEPEKTESTEIKWKQGKNLTKKTVKKTQKNKKSGAKRVVTKEVDDDSFFSSFSRNLNVLKKKIRTTKKKMHFHLRMKEYKLIMMLLALSSMN